ncbi:hypothetical protein CIK84_06375 [Glutamicibacter arilaitensis]|uniref:Uncharacterized protein n=1 Tax=Glutamicibacter arilaitensis TaxID=256701 RepID=A0A2N7S4W6_9MICC|nr:hypothetical protein CIK84_06375 [Glutamicibacter arilaitensis]
MRRLAVRQCRIVDQREANVISADKEREWQMFYVIYREGKEQPAGMQIFGSWSRSLVFHPENIVA